ncbi:MAG: hypothetical protein IKQ97_10395 [Eubacterium sp.]|nr:hypothetical protein [Eubacterium sp.]
MKRRVAGILAVLMMMTTLVCAGGAKTSQAAGKVPTATFSGIEEIHTLKDGCFAVEVGKTINVPFKNVKKSDVKDLTIYVDDPRVVDVTKKTLPKNKVGFQLKFKKIGYAVINTRLTLKKKQAGGNMWWRNINVVCVKKLKKSEIDSIEKKAVTEAANSKVMEKYGHFLAKLKNYDEKEELNSEETVYEDKEGVYSGIKFISKDKVDYEYNYYSSGSSYCVLPGMNFSGFFFDFYDNYSAYKRFPQADDPSQNPNQADDMKELYGYYDGTYYYRGFEGNDQSGNWNRAEDIIEAKTFVPKKAVIFYKSDKGKVYKRQEYTIDYEADAPDIYTHLKLLCQEDSSKKVKVEAVVEPGTPKETKISREIPFGASFYLNKFTGYGIFADAEGKTPIEDNILRDIESDMTVYYIKTE